MNLNYGNGHPIFFAFVLPPDWPSIKEWILQILGQTTRMASYKLPQNTRAIWRICGNSGRAMCLQTSCSECREKQMLLLIHLWCTISHTIYFHLGAAVLQGRLSLCNVLVSKLQLTFFFFFFNFASNKVASLKFCWEKKDYIGDRLFCDEWISV